MAMGTWRVDPQENRELQIKSGVDKKKLLGSTKQTTKDGAKKSILHTQLIVRKVFIEIHY